MKLHTLRVTAFGPFADTVEVDFDEVSAAGLFLIQGPTGAGKTSLLDAVCYALYAGLPGARRGSRRLRSDHAADLAVPEVVLDFTTGRRRFRVTRSPEFERPKKRGTGTTRAPATVLLQEHVGGRWVVRSTRSDEVGEIVTEVLGMGLEQFSKVVLLPQGEFSAFLRADAEERRGLLERLFDISTWTGVEEWLVDQRRTLAEQVEQARAGVATDLARLRDAVVTLPPEVAGDDAWTVEHLESLPSALTGLAQRCEEHGGSTLAELDAADGRVTLAEQSRLEVEALAERQRRARAATVQLAELLEAEPDLTAAARRVERSRLADLVTTDLAARERARARVGTVATHVTRLRHRLGLGPEADSTHIDRALVELTGHDPGLADARRADRERHELARRLQQLGEQEAAAAGEVEQLTARTATLLERQVEARDAVEAHRARSREHSVLRARHETLGELVWVAAALSKAQASATRLADEHRDARDDELGAHEAYLTARQSRLDGMAAELASRLEDDHRCPVCGALEHPVPAAPGGDAVSPEQVGHAEELWG
ncbi:MAG: SMC family ATPase, partial [Actinomycetota bacterium]|nr:SMC family ATPase [Actinomycetota bacterium]